MTNSLSTTRIVLPARLPIYLCPLIVVLYRPQETVAHREKQSNNKAVRIEVEKVKNLSTYGSLSRLIPCSSRLSRSATCAHRAIMVLRQCGGAIWGDLIVVACDLLQKLAPCPVQLDQLLA